MEGSNARKEREGTGRKEIRKERKEVMEWKEVMEETKGEERDGRK